MENIIKAVVQKVIQDGKHGPFVVATSEEIEGSVTFSLEPTIWLEVDQPEEGMLVLLGELRKKRAGWRAKKGRFWRLSDEQTEKSKRTMPFTFRKDMMVKLTGLPLKWYGEGPYRIVEVRWVDRKCNCPGEGHDHYEGCRTFSAKSVGHHQSLTVQIQEKEIVFSGDWLVPA